MEMIPLKPIFELPKLTPVCQKCKHLMTDTPHVCETVAEKERRERLISEMAAFSETFDHEP